MSIKALLDETLIAIREPIKRVQKIFSEKVL